MANQTSLVTLGKQIRTLFDAGALGSRPDRGLLDQFARGDETSEAAFATLVERHGMMVLRVCRHLLGDGHLAEDAFQVTFLLLARRARSIHNPDSLAGWLHRVARRVALRARVALSRRHDRERPEAGEIAVAPDNPVERDELCAIVHEEIDRLSHAQRLPIVLCASRDSRTKKRRSDCDGRSGPSRAGWSGAAAGWNSAWLGGAWPPPSYWPSAWPRSPPRQHLCRWRWPCPQRGPPCKPPRSRPRRPGRSRRQSPHRSPCSCKRS